MQECGPKGLHVDIGSLKRFRIHTSLTSQKSFSKKGVRDLIVRGCMGINLPLIMNKDIRVSFMHFLQLARKKMLLHSLAIMLKRHD
jgi:hypothetical protein